MKITIGIICILLIWVIYELKMHLMRIKPLELIRFFLIALPVFIVVYCTAMISIEIKEFIKR